MAGYLVLARKYRSTTFDEVVGQEPIAQTLKSAIATGRVAHAYLFTGTRGVGKTTMARILAKALNCLNSDGPTATPCNKCDACVAIARGDDVDVVEIDGASNRGIDEIRELRANAIFRPSRSRYKIYYIDEVHMLTKEAFNALLKTLEEPPEHVKFIFATTETEKVPATILSRCQKFDFRNIPTRQIAQHLEALCKAENVLAEPNALFRVARCAAGSMRDGLSLLDQLMAAGAGKVTDEEVLRVLGTPSEDRMLSIARAVSEGNAAVALGELNAVLEGGVSLNSAVNALCDVFRNMMLAAACGPTSDLIELGESQRQIVGELSKKFTLPTLVQSIGVLSGVAYKTKGSSVARGLVEAALVRLAEADKFIDPASLLERLEALASGAPIDQKKNSLGPAVAAGTAPTASRAGGYSSSYSSSSAPSHSSTPSSQTSRAPYGGQSAQNPGNAVPGHSGSAGYGGQNSSASAAPGYSGGAGYGASNSGANVPNVNAPNAMGGANASNDNAPGVAGGAEAIPAVQWDGAWLTANWGVVLQHLAARKQSRLVGALRMTRVIGFDGGVLKLGFDQAGEPLRVQCMGSMNQPVNAALTELAGREIRCEYVTIAGMNTPVASVSSPADAPASSAAPRLSAISTAEKGEILKDTSVRAVLDLFGGEVTDMQRTRNAEPVAEGEET